MKPRVSISKYFNSHGKQPRGYGLWMFRIREQELAFTGWYSDAVAFARKAAKAANVYDIEVLP